MKIKHESFENIGIYTISGDISSDHEDNLKLLLMKAVNGINRPVLNLRGVNKISRNCLTLLNKAYCASLRLKNPIIMTEVPEIYLPEIFSCNSLNNDVLILNNKTTRDSGKSGVLNGAN